MLRESGSFPSPGLIARERRAVLAAVIYFTRIPLPRLPALAAEDWQRATTYWPLIGLGVGIVTAAVYVLASLGLPAPVCAGLALAAGVILTGAQHEDGFIDVCDGLGAATKERMLEIMRDSRIGAFGAIGIVLMLGLKWQALAAMPFEVVPFALVAGHAFSRTLGAAVMAVLSYARTDESRAKPMVSDLGGDRLGLVIALGIVPLVLLPGAAILPAAMAGAAMWTACVASFRSRLDGYTGDCLGATQQLCELAILLSVLAAV
ncbi:adenosylcobinamide-GDP ribazoletransferase [Blastochloris viridis]|uniref:Adenosylcobinamide-GDP ribazoletransferase n=1 Tax=Blastochloris viridis TaxID=1079 RepID=A0A0H5BQ47_BLAVI|nr:adenosylcobinamide-GDP ribazoletransferase [Blastochloris viridis]ALK09763.1 Cobalamin synthase [Blastochloris viridis]BAS00339.1 cobalamin synthase [Blastochloris viridis]CUU42426.1 cobalamin synthase [Blastochloris viridis]